MLILALQSLTLLFERYARKIVTRRLFGLSFGRRYREFLVIFGAVWVGEMALALLANSVGLNPFATATDSGAATASATLGIGVATLMIYFLFLGGGAGIHRASAQNRCIERRILMTWKYACEFTLSADSLTAKP